MESTVFENIRECVTEAQLKSLVFSMRKHLKAKGVDVAQSAMLDAMAAGLGKGEWRAVKAAYNAEGPHLAAARELLRGESVWIYFETSTTDGGWSRTMPEWVRLHLTPELLARVWQLAENMRSTGISETVLDAGFRCVWDQSEELHFLYEELVVTPHTIYLRLFQQDNPEGHTESIGQLMHELVAALKSRKSGEPVFFVEHPEDIEDQYER
jgi:hypothetical protein